MYRSAEEVDHHTNDDAYDEVNVPAIKYANSGSSTSRGNYSGRESKRIANRIVSDQHHSEESSADSYDNVPLILGNTQQGEFCF